MKLRTVLSHKFGTSVKVDGQKYDIDDEGFLEVEDTKHALKLLQNNTWQRAVERTPSKAKSQAKDKPKDEPKDKPKEKPKEEEENGADYPDPSMSLTLPKLREMADAYEVPYTSKTKKAELVELLNEAMYE